MKCIIKETLCQTSFKKFSNNQDKPSTVTEQWRRRGFIGTNPREKPAGQVCITSRAKSSEVLRQQQHEWNHTGARAMRTKTM